MSVDDFNPNTAIDQYMVKRNQVQLIIDRGYAPMNEYLSYDDSVFLTLDQDQMITASYRYIYGKSPSIDHKQQSALGKIFNAVYSNGQFRIGVFYLEVEKGKNEIPKNAVILYTTGAIGQLLKDPANMIKNVIFIAPKKLNPHAIEEIKDLSNYGISVQVFTWIEMLSICPNHLYNGKSFIMDKADTKEFILAMITKKDYSIPPYNAYLNSLPNFNATDPIPKYYGAKGGDLIVTNTQVFTHNSVLRETEFIRKVI